MDDKETEDLDISIKKLRSRINRLIHKNPKKYGTEILKTLKNIDKNKHSNSLRYKRVFDDNKV